MAQTVGSVLPPCAYRYSVVPGYLHARRNRAAASAKSGHATCRYGIGAVSGNATAWTTGQNINECEAEFHRQKEAFENIPPLLLAPYRGQHVVSDNGQILDSDRDAAALAQRFFSHHPNSTAIIRDLGESKGPIVIDTPFFD